ncbi:MAG: hypothetical protein FWE05_00375 [Defluviitaleaceae bacterium]|nr:hypothetical protein [Defluviitaleaceae bacterium]
MTHILEMPAFTIKEGVSEADFLRAHEKFNHMFMKKQEGYVSHKLIRQGDNWFDIAVWDSIKSKEKAFKDIYDNTAAMEYVTLINEIGTDDDIPIFSVVRDYES